MPTPMTGTWGLAGGNNITLSQSGNTVTISGANAGGGGTISMYPQLPPAVANSVPLTQSNSAGAGGGSTQSSQTQWAWVTPIVLEANLVANNIRMAGSHSIQSGATGSSGTYKWGGTFGLYTRTASTLNSVSSWTHSMIYSHNSSTASSNGSWGFTFAYGGPAGASTVQSSTSLSANSSVIINPINGSKFIPFNVTSNSFSIPAGQYYAVFMQSSQTGLQQAIGSLSQVAMLSVTQNYFSEMGDSVANVTTPWPLLGQMSWVQTSNTTPALTQALAANSSFTNIPASIHVTNITTTAASGATASFNQFPFVQMITRAD